MGKEEIFTGIRICLTEVLDIGEDESDEELEEVSLKESEEDDGEETESRESESVESSEEEEDQGGDAQEGGHNVPGPRYPRRDRRPPRWLRDYHLYQQRVISACARILTSVHDSSGEDKGRDVQRKDDHDVLGARDQRPSCWLRDYNQFQQRVVSACVRILTTVTNVEGYI